MRRKKSKGKVMWGNAPDIDGMLSDLITKLNLDWLDRENIHSFRSANSSARAYARIWGLNKVWQMALGAKPAYVIEVLSEHFDKLPDKEKSKVLLHEIAHIPKNFSGSLLPHTRKRGKRNFHDRVEELYAQYLKMEKNERKENSKSESILEKFKRPLLGKINF